MAILYWLEDAGYHLFGSVDCELFDNPFNSCAHDSQPISVWFEGDYAGHFLLIFRGLCQIKLHGHSVGNVLWFPFFVELFALLFEFLFFGYNIQCSYIIESPRITIKVFALIRHILHDYDAADHKSHILLPHNLQLITDGIRVDAERSI